MGEAWATLAAMVGNARGFCDVLSLSLFVCFWSHGIRLPSRYSLSPKRKNRLLFCTTNTYMRKVGEVAHACIFISTKHITSSFIHKYTQTMPTLKHIRQDASVAMTPAVMPAQQPAPALAPSSAPAPAPALMPSAVPAPAPVPSSALSLVALSSAPVPAPDPSPAPTLAHPPPTKYQKNCSECTRSHRSCVFESPSDLQCTRCIKMHLPCFFKYSGESYNACSTYFLNSTHPMYILFNFFKNKATAMISCQNVMALSRNIPMIDTS